MAITPSDVKDRLVGLGGLLKKASLLDPAYTDTNIQERIDSATRRFERETNFRINKVQKYTYADGVYVTTGSTQTSIIDANIPVIEETPYDYILDDVKEFFRLRLNDHPVITIHRLFLAWNRQFKFFTFPDEWIQVNKTNGLLTIMPFRGAGATVAMSAVMATFIQGFASSANVPSVINVDYTVGLPTTWADMSEWRDLRKCIEEYSAYFVLSDIQELLPQGLRELGQSADGISQSFNYSFFEQRMETLMGSVQTYQETLKARTEGIMFTVI